MTMKNRQSGPWIRPGRGWPWAILLPVAFALGLAFPAGGVANAGTAPGAGAGQGGDDETIGTLPILGNQGQLLLVRRARDVRPDFYLEGAYDELLATIVGFTGSGSVTYLPLADGRVRLGFHGALELALDRGLMQATQIEVGSHVPGAFRNAQAWSGFAGQFTPTRALRAGEFALPVAALDAAGQLEQNPWILGARSRARGSYLFHALADGAVLYVGQTY
jgi:hypothetical protein